MDLPLKVYHTDFGYIACKPVFSSPRKSSRGNSKTHNTRVQLDSATPIRDQLGALNYIAHL